MALGRNIDRIERNIESIESKFAKIFKRPKNREDGSDFDDFWTESIVSTQSIFSKIFERTKNYRIDRIDQFKWAGDRLIDRIDRWPPCLRAVSSSSPVIRTHLILALVSTGKAVFTISS